ncbi:MAG: chromosome segregation protein SMC, partial [Deltaproteobacteria bacterium HGW-Deltaproteobacteria-14]
ARVLGDAERRRLQALREAVARAEAQATARLEAARSTREEHAQRRPAELPAEATVGVAQAAAAAARRELEEASQELGALTSDVTRHQAQLRRFAAEKDAWDARRETMNLWKRLHRLIGEGDGKAFQEFAQILNLQELVDRANGHLRALAPRYALITAVDGKGRPRLDFAIRDAWLAGRQRPITTLSGGETFQVSLALALGLADMRTRGMPLETLLLDEGFGTLDPRALDHAVEALERLHARSRIQVGVISHVEALRERIEARVVVEALGNGHSRLRPELGGARDGEERA